jgi:uncharacterized protein YndB with AHSA1/START domain
MDDQRLHLPPGTETTRWIRTERRLDAPPERVFRAWADPEELARWFPERVEGGLAAGARTILVWAETRTWWDVLEVHPSETFRFRWPSLTGEGLVTTVAVKVEPVGYGSRVELEDGPFALDTPGGIDAWAAAIATWAEALTMLRAQLDMSADVRERR